MLNFNEEIHIYDENLKLIGVFQFIEERSRNGSLQSVLASEKKERMSELLKNKKLTDEIESEIKTKKKKSSKNLFPIDIVDIIAEKFLKALKAYNISADYFIHEKLGQKNRKTLLNIYNGNLGLLNDQTAEALRKGELKKIDGGLSLLKSALIYELYINSTLVGRSVGEVHGVETGRNMKGILTYVNLLKKDGSLKKSEKEYIYEEQKEIIEFIKKQTEHYKDKSDVINRVYQKIRFDWKRDLMERGKRKINCDRFKAILIFKLYENTNRLDRGDGIAMIGLTRGIMDF